MASGTVDLGEYISQNCTIENYAISPMPAGASLDAATGVLTWQPTTAISTKRALIDLGATWSGNSAYSDGTWTDARLTSIKGFHNAGTSSEVYTNTVTFPSNTYYYVLKFTFKKVWDADLWAFRKKRHVTGMSFVYYNSTGSY